MSELPDGQSTTLLVAFINRLKTLSDQISELQADMTDVCKEARDVGFDSTKLREVVAWLKKIDKHGSVKMEESEALFDLYRSVHQGKAKGFDEMMNTARDRALLAVFAPDDQTEQKLNKSRRAMRSAVAMARGAREARGE